MNEHTPPQRDLSLRLLAGLARFRSSGVCGNRPHGEYLFSYCALERERLAEICLPHPLIGIVVAGAKEVWRGTSGDVLRPGSMFVLPAKVELDILNIPEEGTGCYQSLILEVPDPGAFLDVQPCAPLATRPKAQSIRITLTPHLVDAIIHATSAIADGPSGSTVRRSRLTELLALLHGEPAAAPLFDTSISNRIAQLVRGDLSRGWTVPEVAAALGLSESTMRRRLTGEGTSFSRLLRHERMQLARLLVDRKESCQSAATAVGYASRAHFARHFRSEFGSNPSGINSARR
jgi:AraC-like DNA-binding protein